MTHYIDKEALLIEIDKLKQNLSASPIVVIEDVIALVESFEAKEVDLKKEIADQYESNYEEYLTYEEFADIAKYFFELGLKAKQGQTRR